MPTANEVVINGVTYALAAQSLLPTGKRAIERNHRETNARDKGRIRLVQWEYAGPIGASLESVSGRLGHNFSGNLETRFPRRLIPTGARTVVTLDALDPPDFGSGLFAGFTFGGSPFGTSVSGGDVTAFDEQGGSIFAHRGLLTTQVRIDDWTVVDTHIHDGAVVGAVTWFGLGRLALGNTAVMQTRTAVTAINSVYANTVSTSPAASVYANGIALGSDRCWIVKGDASLVNDNLATYTLDSFATMANPFQVGDPRNTINGMGSFGPYMLFGSTHGIFSFTDQGKPVPLSRALVGHESSNNGQQWADPGWGWEYYIADTGLRATNGYTDNPVGIGERMREFTGHSGTPSAIFQERGELFVAYAWDGDTYLYRCTFGPETAATGQPELYPMHLLPVEGVNAIFSTNTPEHTAIVWGEGTDMAYETIDRHGRDDLFGDREYSATGGRWQGTALDRDPHLLKVIRVARLRTRNLDGAIVTLFGGFDDGASDPDVELGVVSTDGYHELHPVDTGVPLTTVAGRTFAPMIVIDLTDWTPDDEPPEVAGVLEIEYDERPEYIEDIELTLQLAGTPDQKRLAYAQLEALVEAAGPHPVALPNELTYPVVAQRYAMVADLQQRIDIKGDGVETVAVHLHMWETA